jgi:hypothetical protein
MRMLRRFASLRPGLEQVAIRNHNPLALVNVWYTHEASVTWKRAALLREEDHSQGRPLSVVSWTPGPAAISRW